jgi:hypothetical protein
MDGGKRLPSSKGTYMVEVDGIPIEFHGVELAPPCGVFGVNYSRYLPLSINKHQTQYYLRHIHFEYQPHRYAMAWTTDRTAGSEAGGHFFHAAYGVRIQGAANTLTIWEPRSHHGTSLQNVDPLDKSPSFHQTGMSIVTSNTIKSAWKKYYEEGMKEPVRECSATEETEDPEY